MGERGQKGKEGLRMQPYCVSWRDLDSEALVLWSVQRPCFRLGLQHLPPATPVPSSNTPLHTACITMHYHVIGNIPEQENVCERAVFLHSRLTPQLWAVSWHLGKKQRTLAQTGALAFGWCNRAPLLFGSRYSELGHCLRGAVLQTAYSGQQLSRFRHHFLMNCVCAVQT